jgi:hypothetical protein
MSNKKKVRVQKKQPPVRQQTLAERMNDTGGLVFYDFDSLPDELKEAIRNGRGKIEVSAPPTHQTPHKPKPKPEPKPES